MQPNNIKHLKRVAGTGGALTLAIAGASLMKFSHVFAFSVVVGGALAVFNIYSIIRLVEALAGAAAAGVSGKSGKAATMMIHIFKLGLIAGVLVALALAKKLDLFGFLAGFTAILIANLAAGLKGLGADAGGRDTAE